MTLMVRQADTGGVDLSDQPALKVSDDDEMSVNRGPSSPPLLPGLLYLPPPQPLMTQPNTPRHCLLA